MLRRTRGVVQLAARWAPGIGRADDRAPSLICASSICAIFAARSPGACSPTSAPTCSKSSRRAESGTGSAHRSSPTSRRRTGRWRSSSATPTKGRSDRSRRSPPAVRVSTSFSSAPTCCSKTSPLVDRDRLGFDPAAVRERHPHLLHVAIADFGLTGPRAAWTAEPICALGCVGGALRRRLRRSAALQRARSPRSRLRRDLRGGGGAGGARRPGANRPRANGRGLRAGGRARRFESVVDPARRLRAALSAVACPHAAQR